MKNIKRFERAARKLDRIFQPLRYFHGELKFILDSKKGCFRQQQARRSRMYLFTVFSRATGSLLDATIEVSVHTRKNYMLFNLTESVPFSDFFFLFLIDLKHENMSRI